MKVVLQSIFIALSLPAAGIVLAQAPPPPAPPPPPSTPVLRDDDIRLRSVELEKVKREAQKSNVKDKSTDANNGIESKYDEIKEDFEGMQLSQQQIIKAYSTGEKIDLETIKSAADKITGHAIRLNLNLFAIKLKDDDRSGEDSTKTLRNLIVDLDNAIGDVVTSEIFKNLRVIDQPAAEKTQADLTRVAEISQQLSKKAEKQ